LTGCAVVPDAGAPDAGAPDGGGVGDGLVAPRSPDGGAPMSDGGGGCAMSRGRGGHSITDDDCAYAAAALPSTQTIANTRRIMVLPG
jgi:hypothetical protein